jgi:hypothetical protein
MAKNIKTHLYCYDDHRAFAEDVKRRFIDTKRYTVLSFQTREDFISCLETEKLSNFCKVAILGMHDSPEQFEMISQLTAEVKSIDQRTGLILVGPPDKMNDIKKAVKFNIDAYIPKNANAILRIHNTVKRLISQHSIGIFKKRRNFSFYILLAFLLISALLAAIAYIKLPGYF